MSTENIAQGLITYVGMLILLTFHEWGHAWMAHQCGDDTAKERGRLSLNPIVHIDLIGTVLIPLAIIFLSAAGSGAGRFLVGWAKPVPVNINNFRRPRVDDILVSMAGPAMNVLLAVGLLVGARLALELKALPVGEVLEDFAWLSLMLCFFNLLPIPPLDGSHVVRVLINMSYETYWRIAQYGFIVLILVLQLQPVRHGLMLVTNGSFVAIAKVVSLGG